MWKKQSVGVLLVICLSVLVFTGCDDDDWDEFWSDWDLEGRWEVSEVSHEGPVIFTYEVYIDQHGRDVDIERGGQRLSDGYISGDRIYVSDWYDYDIERIYIDSERQMHSNQAEHRDVHHLEFERITY